MPVSGLFSSCATPATSWPRAANFSERHQLMMQARVFDGDGEVGGEDFELHHFAAIDFHVRGVGAEQAGNRGTSRARK